MRVYLTILRFSGGWCPRIGKTFCDWSCVCAPEWRLKEKRTATKKPDSSEETREKRRDELSSDGFPAIGCRLKQSPHVFRVNALRFGEEGLKKERDCTGNMTVACKTEANLDH